MLSLKNLACIWLLLVVALAGYAYQQAPKLDSSLMALLPDAQQTPLIEEATQQVSQGFSDRLLLILAADDEVALRAQVTQTAQALQKHPDVKDVLWHLEDEQGLAQQLLYDYRYVLLSQDVRDAALKGDFLALSNRALANIYSPVSSVKSSIIEDPFGLFASLALSQGGAVNIQPANGLLKVVGQSVPTYLLALTVDQDVYSLAVQQRLLGAVAAQQQRLEAAGVSVQKSGLILHAAAGAEQAKWEVSVIGVSSLIGICLLLLSIFRSVSALLVMLLPLAVGFVTAAAVTSLFYAKLHLITLAFGAGLIGVSIDYVLHFMCERQVSSAKRALHKILPGLLLGLMSSVLAYGVQALAPFPGLQQMALFCVVGLVAAWLTVVLCFPYLFTVKSNCAVRSAAGLKKAIDAIASGSRRPVWLLIMTALFCAALVSLYQSRGVDDVRLLQTSPTTLLEQEKRVQAMLGATSANQFFVVRGGSYEQSLQREELLRESLDILIQQGIIDAYQAISQSLPSRQRQQQNAELVTNLYTAQLRDLYRQLGLGENREALSLEYLEKNIAKRLSFERWLTEIAEQQQRLQVVVSGAEKALLVRVKATNSLAAVSALEKAASSVEGVEFIDTVENISTLLQDFREQITAWVLLAYAAIFAILFMRYRGNVWRVVAPPFFAAIVTLGAIAQLEGGINLFHLLALILVLGIGLDIGIFLVETRESSMTWLAVSLSTLTSVLAFGLLALSKTPVLHHFGLTVLIGLVAVWIFTLTVRFKFARE